MSESEPRATDALANERTFLAYARTALAFVGFGFVLARFSLFTREVAQLAHLRVPPPSIATGLGTAMAAVGVSCAIFGGYRYVAAARALRAGAVDPLSDRAALAGAGLIGVIGVIVAITIVGLR